MRLRLILSFLLIVLISVVSVVLIVRQGALREVRAFMLRGSMTDVDELVDSLQTYYASNGSWTDVGTLLMGGGMGRGQMHGQNAGGMMGAQGASMNQRLRVADAQGALVADSSEANPTGSLDRSELAEAISLEVGGKTVGYLLAEGGIGLSTTDESFLASRISRAALYAGLIAIGSSLVLALVLAYQLMRPVRELTQAATSLASGDLSHRVPVRGSDELASLGTAFNQMAYELQKAEENRRSMTADIAHELRNPLAVQRANLEALQDGVYPLTPQNLDPILEQNQLLTRLVDDLRTLALADSGMLDLRREATDLSELISHVVERSQSQANARQIKLNFLQGVLLPKLLIDPQRIDQILSNLLSNALRHTPDGGQVTVSLGLQVQQAIIDIRDSGPGIPPDALESVFQRFYRADKSRSRSEGGTGLGLTIARQLSEAHGGTLTAANHPQGGAVFTLKLPVS